MDYRSGDSVVLAWRDSKAAALYFDYVVPLRSREILDVQETDIDDVYEFNRAFEKIAVQILPPSLRSSWNDDPVRACRDQGWRYLPAAGQAPDTSDATYGDRLKAMLLQSSITSFCVYGESMLPSVETNSGFGDPSLLLTEIDTVDSNSIEWSQILEFRKDVQRVKQLRKLRRFIFKEYEGKSIDYIKEDLEERIELYEDVTKFWGFPTNKGLFQIALTTEATGMLAALSSALFGAPLLPAAIAGGAIVLGKGMLAIAQRKREVNLERERNPIAYLAEAMRLEREPQ